MKKKQLLEQLAALKTKRDALLAVTEPENITEHLAASKAAAAEVSAVETQLAQLAELEALAVANVTREPARVTSDNEAKRPFANLGEQLAAVAYSQSPAGSFHGLGGQTDKRLFETNLAATGASANVPTDGGFLIGTEFSTALMAKMREAAKLFPLCKEVPIGEGNDSVELPYIDETSRATGSRWGGVRVYRAAEADAPTASKPKINRMELRLESIKGLAYATERLLRNAPAMSAIFEDAFSSEMAFTIDDEIWRGNGVGQCLGFSVAKGDNTSLMITVSKESAQTADTINATNVAKMLARLRRSQGGNVRWLVNQDTLPQFPLMTIGQQPVFVPGGSFANAPFGTLLGIPILPVEQAESIGDLGDIVLADMSQFMVITQGGVKSASSMHVRFIYDEMTFKWSWDVNGQPVVKKPITPYKGSATLSPFVALEAR